MAHLDLEDSEFSRKLDADVKRIEEYERRSHEIRLTPKVDESDTAQARRAFQRLDQQITNDARSRGGVLGILHGMFGRGGQMPQGGRGGSFLGRVLGAAGPGLNNVLPIGARAGLITAGAGVGLGALPALAAPLLTGGVGALGAGVAALGARAVIGTKKDPGQLFAPAQQALKQLDTMLKQAAQPLVAPLEHVFKMLPGLIRQVGPALHSLFAGASTLILPVVHGLADLARMVLPLLGQAFRAAAPFMRPLIDGIGMLLRGLLPGVIALIRAAGPAIRVFAQILGMLGRDIGQMLKDFAPVLKQSAVIFKALADVVGALFPVIGKLAAVFARALAPVVKEFSRVIVALTPVLVIIGKLLADLAGAVLADLVAVFKAVADLIVGISPALAQFARAFGQVFKILENSGVFGVIASALEQLAKPLGRTIGLLLRGLAPLLPPLIKFLGTLADMLARGLAKAILALLPPLTDLALTVLQALADLLPVLLPLFAELVGLLTPVFVRIVQDLASALDAVIKAVPPKVLELIALGFLAIWAAIKIGGLISAASNPIVLIGVAVGLLIVGIVELVKHWHQVWGVIKSVARDAWEFLTHGWGQYLFPGLYVIRKVVEFVRDHWRQAWADMKQAGQDLWQWLWNDFGAKIVNFFTQTLPNAFTTAVKAIGNAWDKIKSIIRTPVAWVVDNVLDGLIRVFDWITSKVGLGKPIKEVHPFGLQRGGRLPGYGGPDQFPALLGPGETVVSAEDSRQPFMRAAFEAAGVPGYQQGGLAGARANLPSLQRATKRSGGWLGDAANFLGGLVHKAGDIGKITAAIFSGNTTALVNAIGDMLGHRGTGGATGLLGGILTAIPRQLIHDIAHYFVGQGGGASANAIVKYAMSFLGKVPYVWGGTSPAGWDCSGFVDYIYNHFGIHPPRTADAQWGWVRRVGSPTPGGLVFGAGADGSAANPGHVGIAMGRGRMINAYTTGTNTIISPIVGSMGAVTGYGIPPGGFAGAGRGMAQRGSWTLPGLEGLWRQAGGPGGLVDHIAGAIAMAESGGNPRARNPSGASGLWQILGQVFPGNIFNPFINARNAVRKYYQAGGFSPWVTYTSGAYRQFMDSGGWLMPGGMNGTGRPEAVLNPSQSQAFLALAEAAHALSRPGGSAGLERALERLIRAAERSPGKTGAAVAEALNRGSRQAAYVGMYGGGP